MKTKMIRKEIDLQKLPPLTDEQRVRLDVGTGLSDQSQHFQNKNFNGQLVMNKCHQCGSTSYKPIIRRDDQGVMRPSGQYQCTGCNLVFANFDEWRVDKQIPVDLKAPNAETRAAMAEADEIARVHSADFASADDLFDDLEKNSRQ